MNTIVRTLRGSEVVALKNEETYPNKNLDTMMVSNLIRQGMENVYGIFDGNELIGSVSVFYRVTLFGMQLSKDTVQLYDIWSKNNSDTSHMLLDRVMVELKEKGYKQVLVAMNHVSYEETQMLQRVGIREVVGSYKSNFMEGTDAITVFGKVLSSR